MRGLRDHTARLTAAVHVGEGATMTIVNPRSFADGGPEWVMRYGNPIPVRYQIAELIASYDYLLSSAITADEAIRRLRLMRISYRSLASLSPNGGQTEGEKRG